MIKKMITNSYGNDDDTTNNSSDNMKITKIRKKSKININVKVYMFT